jgi:hypothetical protein
LSLLPAIPSTRDVSVEAREHKPFATSTNDAASSHRRAVWQPEVLISVVQRAASWWLQASNQMQSPPDSTPNKCRYRCKDTDTKAACEKNISAAARRRVNADVSRDEAHRYTCLAHSHRICRSNPGSAASARDSVHYLMHTHTSCMSVHNNHARLLYTLQTHAALRA